VTSAYGGPADSDILSHVAVAGGRQLVVRASAEEGGVLEHAIVDAEGLVTEIGRSGGGNEDLWYEDAAAMASADGNHAFIVVTNPTPDELGGIHSEVLYADVRSDKLRSLGKEAQPITLLAVDGQSAWFTGTGFTGKPELSVRRILPDGSLTSESYLLPSGTGHPQPANNGGAPGWAPTLAAARSRLAFVDANGVAYVTDAQPERYQFESRPIFSTATRMHSVIDLGGAFVFAGESGVYRSNGTAGGTQRIISAAQAGGAILSVRASADAKWLYMVVRAGSGKWRVVRTPAAAPGTPTLVAAQPDSWDLREPRVWAAVGDDVVLAADQPSKKRPLRTHAIVLVAGNIAKAKRYLDVRGDGLITTRDSLVLRTSGSTMLRVRGNATREFTTPGGIDQMSATPSGVSFVAETEATGRELFHYRFDSIITGTIYGDLDADQSRDAGERGLAGWRVYVDANDNGRFDRNERSVLTEGDGRFEFFELDPGRYKLRVSTGARYAMTTGTAYGVTVVAGKSVTKRFGARPIV
jgi:hypothetical protein